MRDGCAPREKRVVGSAPGQAVVSCVLSLRQINYAMFICGPVTTVRQCKVDQEF